MYGTSSVSSQLWKDLAAYSTDSIAGNDAHFTMHALLLLAVESYRDPLKSL